jgi:solute carrier family 5 (high affinity choline transporter), member 7
VRDCEIIDIKQICDINGDINFCHGDLGATLAVIIDMEKETSVIFSACIAVFYTLFGGLYSVAYTDVIQLFCIFIGLWMCIPFAWTNPHVKSLSGMEVDWIGEIGEKKFWFYVDYGLLLVFGGIPWQVRHRKRFLSPVNVKSVSDFRYTSSGCCRARQRDERRSYRMWQLSDAC